MIYRLRLNIWYASIALIRLTHFGSNITLRVGSCIVCSVGCNKVIIVLSVKVIKLAVYNMIEGIPLLDRVQIRSRNDYSSNGTLVVYWIVIWIIYYCGNVYCVQIAYNSQVSD